MEKKEWKQAKKAYKKAKHRAIRPWKGMSIFSAIFAVVFIAVFVICSTFDNTLAAFNGGTFWKLENEDADAQYFTSDFDKVEDNVAYGTDLCQRVEAEGAALLMNENDALPLKEGAKVSTFSNSRRKYRLWWNPDQEILTHLPQIPGKMPWRVRDFRLIRNCGISMSLATVPSMHPTVAVR